MTLPRNDQLKTSLVAKLKANATILAQLPDDTEIREAQWQGTEFTYPNVRVRVIENRPHQENCDYSIVKFGIAVFSEEASSQECDKIAGIISNELHTQSFSQVGLKFTSVKIENIIPAIRIDERTWMSEVILNGIVNG